MTDLKDRIRGMIYGQCLGDAIGLITEFKHKVDKPEIKFPYTESIRNFPPNDWTDDSDHMILVMQSITERGELEVKDIAAKLKNWVSYGFPELGDTAGLGLGGTMSMVINHQKFLEDPIYAAEEIWYRSGKKLASNGSLMRTSILSAMQDYDTVITMSAKLSCVTHADPRCVAACVLLNHVLYGLLHNPNGHIDGKLIDAVKAARPHISREESPGHDFTMRHQPTPRIYWDERFKTREDELAWWVKTGYTQPVSALGLDELGKIGFVFKCLGAAIYAMQVIKYAQNYNMTPSFRRTIIKIAAECGDADTNCAVAGAVMGAYLGYRRLPQNWIRALPHREWLDKQIDAFFAIYFDGHSEKSNEPGERNTKSDLVADLIDLAGPSNLSTNQLESQYTL